MNTKPTQPENWEDLSESEQDTWMEQNAYTFTPSEFHDRIKRQVQPFPSLLQSAEDERRRTRNAEADQVEQHGAAESFSEWLDERGDSIDEGLPWSLLDEGRSDGQGESYAERNA